MIERSQPHVSDRVKQLHAQMTFEEKIGQLVSYWVDRGDEVVAPMQGEMAAPERYEEAAKNGIGHLTRVYGTRPVDPTERAKWLWAEQRRLQTETRLGIPALVHEECLTGLAAWQAATYPTPLAWGATFDPEAVESMASAIGQSMHQLGIHQGLAPVLDVIRDPRWGRVDECIAEDPYLVGTVGTAYVRGLQEAGVHATLKHFVGYSASQSGRNHAPVHAGRREINDVFLPPFEMAVLDGGVRSIMNSYAEIDGVPAAGNAAYLTGVLRDEWGFDGVVVADYFAVDFLHTMHHVARSKAAAGALALRAGIDVELPSGEAYLELEPGDAQLDADIDRAVLRVLAQKEDLGLLDAVFGEPPTGIDLDTDEHRRIAHDLAGKSIVLLRNDGVLPLDASQPATIAVSGPNATGYAALMGCYSFANHVLAHHPDVPLGLEVPDVLEAVRGQFAQAEASFSPGCSVKDIDESDIAAAVQQAAAADVSVVVVGDRAGLFGRGTVGEGNDTESLELPGSQRALVEALVATGTPVVMVLLTGRPYSIGWALDGPSAPAAVLQSFFPGEEGATALAEVMSGVINPSGRLPVSLPRSTGAQPFSYLHTLLGGDSDVTATHSAPTRPFGFGLSYTTFEHTDLVVDESASTDGDLTARVTVTNTGTLPGADVVQLYARCTYRSVTRPVAQLVGFTRVELEPGQSAQVQFTMPSTRLAFTNVEYERVVESGPLTLWVGNTCDDASLSAEATITGPDHAVSPADSRITRTKVTLSQPR